MSILKTSRSSKKLVLQAFKTDKNKVIRPDNDKTNKMVIDLSKSKKSKNNMSKNLTCYKILKLYRN